MRCLRVLSPLWSNYNQPVHAYLVVQRNHTTYPKPHFSHFTFLSNLRYGCLYTQFIRFGYLLVCLLFNLLAIVIWFYIVLISSITS